MKVQAKSYREQKLGCRQIDSDRISGQGSFLFYLPHRENKFGSRRYFQVCTHRCKMVDGRQIQ